MTDSFSRRTFVVAAGAVALGVFAWTRVDDLGLELLPEIHQGEFTAFVGLEVGTPIESSELVRSRRIQAMIEVSVFIKK